MVSSKKTSLSQLWSGSSRASISIYYRSFVVNLDNGRSYLQASCPYLACICSTEVQRSGKISLACA